MPISEDIYSREILDSRANPANVNEIIGEEIIGLETSNLPYLAAKVASKWRANLNRLCCRNKSHR